jgi:hypothetical protein
MNRRNILKSMLFAPFLLSANTKVKEDDTFNITMYGDLDDDLIILKSSEEKTIITDIYQMHNSKGKFNYDSSIYDIKHCGGYIEFKKDYKFEEDELYVVCLANEREEAEYPIEKRFRTHYKNEKLLFNNKIFLKALMPEYDSVPGYPLWFSEGDVPRFNRTDNDGNTYNYYNLHENTVVQTGIIFPKTGEVKIMLFNSENELKYTFNESIETEPKYLKSNELKTNLLNTHIFTEVNNILNLDAEEQIENNEYLTNMLVIYQNKQYNIKFPYPAMYPNLFSVVATKI